MSRAGTNGGHVPPEVVDARPSRWARFVDSGNAMKLIGGLIIAALLAGWGLAQALATKGEVKDHETRLRSLEVGQGRLEEKADWLIKGVDKLGAANGVVMPTPPAPAPKPKGVTP